VARGAGRGAVCKYGRFAKGQKIMMHISPARCIACGFDFTHDGLFVLSGHSIIGDKVVCVLESAEPYYCPACHTLMDRFADVCEDQFAYGFLKKKIEEQEVKP
jgi:hypothetical protein